MKSRHAISEMDVLEEVFEMSREPNIMKKANKHVERILDAKYEQADLRQVICENCTHLSAYDWARLLRLLREYEHLFDGTLGTYNDTPVKLELKDPAAKPFHSKSFSVPQIHEETFKKELDRFVQIGVQRKITNSE
jgi:hypothetical protein